MIVSFKFYVMNFVDFVFDFFSHITSHVSQEFASCTHYTSHSLLNFVYVIVCVFGLTNQVWKYLEFYAKHIWCLRIKENGLKILMIGKLGSKLVFLKNISSHTHAFIHKIQCFEKFLHKICFDFSKICFSKISIDRTYFSINRNCD